MNKERREFLEFLGAQKLWESTESSKKFKDKDILTIADWEAEVDKKDIEIWRFYTEKVDRIRFDIEGVRKIMAIPDEECCEE